MKLKLILPVLFLGMSSSILAQTPIQITASTIVTNIPAGYAPSFYLGADFLPQNETTFPISSSPTTQMIPVERPDDVQIPLIPYLMLTSTKGSIYFNCVGLYVRDVGASPAATIQFEGAIDPVFPWGGVLCVCSGSACSTSHPVSAQPLTQ